MKNSLILIVVFSFFSCYSKANDSLFCIKVHFIYGSKPKREFKNDEKKWFGGIHGGHVGIEVDSNQVFDFIRSGKTHVFSHKKKLSGKYVYRSKESFYARYKASGDSLEVAVVSVFITKVQRQKLDSLIHNYTSQSPHDYAFLGVRCAAAAYSILAELNIFPKHRKSATIRKIFYPKKLRKRVFHLAQSNKWEIEKVKGTNKRWWESDN